MDWDIWVRLWRAGAKFSYTEKVMSLVLWSKDAKTGGFNRRRREELERIIGANDDRVRRLKSRAGFALHYIFEYVTPRFVSDFVRAAPWRKLRTIGGIDRNGRFAGKALMPLVHYADEPKIGFDVHFHTAEKVQINAAGSVLEAFGAGTHRIKFAQAVPAGQTVTLELEAMKGPARLAGVRWL
jgi:hypothetical protein